MKLNGYTLGGYSARVSYRVPNSIETMKQYLKKRGGVVKQWLQMVTRRSR